jgi:hypothetical protein
MKFMKAEEGVPPAGYKIGTVRYYDEEGNVRIRFEGTKAWRCNNPGNMKYKKGGFGMRHGGIGYALSMVVFPTEETGRDALIARLKSPEFRILTIKEFPSIWDKENEVNYRKFILNETGLSPERKIENLTQQEFESFRKAIEKMEGWEEGWEEFYEKQYISAVKRKGSTITEYLVQGKDGQKWLTKAEAVILAASGMLHVIVVHAKKGLYLRPEFHAKAFRDLVR